MKASVSKEDALRFIRALHRSIEEVSDANPGKTYNMGLAIALEEPLIGQSGPEIKSWISKLETMLSQFTESNKIAISVDVLECGGIDAQILTKTKEAYDSSKALQAPKPSLVSADGESAAG
jgi:hypothetical protein